MAETTSMEVARPIKRRRRRKNLALIESPLILEPAVLPWNGYHLKPAKGAFKGIGIDYEPPYESAMMPVGQRVEHPEYDTGRRLERPMELDDVAA